MEVTRLFDLLEKYKEKYSDKEDALASKVNGNWLKVSSIEYYEKAHQISYALLNKKLKKGDKIGLISSNRFEWNIIDMGISMAGMVNVPIYPTIGVDEYAYILEHADIKVLFVGSNTIYKNISSAMDKKNLKIELYGIDDIEGLPNWTELLEEGEKHKDNFKEEVEKIKKETKEDELLTIIYTSGTTGHPKGVMLSHKNIISNAISTSKVENFTSQHRTLSFLPLNHVYERMMNYHFQYKGIGIYYAESMGKISENLKEVRPHIFNTVPRLLEKVYDSIIGKGKNLPFIPKLIFFWALKVGEKFDCHRTGRPFYNIKLAIARKLVFSKWMEGLGGEVRAIVSGGASLQPRLEHIFGAVGIQVCEGYGLTETSPVIAVNWYYPIANFKYGTVGKILENVRVKIADDGEILARGPNIMMGYYKQPELTKEVIDSDGWFHTGDIGTLDEDDFLTITDRKKEIFKLSAGKYIAPQAIENKFKESFFIEQIMVIGENEKFASALISPNFTFLHDWCSKNKLQYYDNAELIQLPEVQARYQKEINQYNSTLADYEKIKRFRLVKESWSPQTGELSPTLKLKRDVVCARYHDLIEEIYAPTREGGKQKTNGLKIGGEIIKTLKNAQQTTKIQVHLRDRDERKAWKKERTDWKNQRRKNKTAYKNNRRTEKVNWKNKRRNDRTEWRIKRRTERKEFYIQREEDKIQNPKSGSRLWKIERKIEWVRWRLKRRTERIAWKKGRKLEKIEWRKNRKKSKKAWRKERRIERISFKKNRKIANLQWKIKQWRYK